MPISSSYVVTSTGTVLATFTHKRKAISEANKIARQHPGQRVNVRTAVGDLIYQCHAQQEGGHRATNRIVVEEL